MSLRNYPEFRFHECNTRTAPVDHSKPESMSTILIIRYNSKRTNTKRYILETYECLNSGEGWSVNIGMA